MSVANRVTYFLEDFILEDGKVGYGGAYLAGKGVVGYAVFVQIPGNLIEVAADPAVLGCQLPSFGTLCPKVRLSVIAGLLCFGRCRPGGIFFSSLFRGLGHLLLDRGGADCLGPGDELFHR